jgi:hypothetical protein
MFRGMSLFCDKSSSVQVVTSRFGVCCVWVGPQAYRAAAGLGRGSGGQPGQLQIIYILCRLNLDMLAS